MSTPRANWVRRKEKYHMYRMKRTGEKYHMKSNIFILLPSERRTVGNGRDAEVQNLPRAPPRVGGGIFWKVVTLGEIFENCHTRRSFKNCHSGEILGKKY
jgi:hypothetical protein